MTVSLDIELTPDSDFDPSLLGGPFKPQVISSATNAAASHAYVLTASLVLTLPANPKVGDTILYANESGVNTGSFARNGKKIKNSSSNYTPAVDEKGTLIFTGDSYGWAIF